jgi:hypothetical protein
MAQIAFEELPDPEPVFIASTLRLARRAEECLAGEDVEYAVKVEPIGRSFLFGTVRMGAAFYVTTPQAEHCRERLTAAGLGKGVVDLAE